MRKFNLFVNRQGWPQKITNLLNTTSYDRIELEEGTDRENELIRNVVSMNISNSIEKYSYFTAQKDCIAESLCIHLRTLSDISSSVSLSDYSIGCVECRKGSFAKKISVSFKKSIKDVNFFNVEGVRGIIISEKLKNIISVNSQSIITEVERIGEGEKYYYITPPLIEGVIQINTNVSNVRCCSICGSVRMATYNFFNEMSYQLEESNFPSIFAWDRIRFADVDGFLTANLICVSPDIFQSILDNKCSGLSSITDKQGYDGIPAP